MSELKDFLAILEADPKKSIKVETTTKKISVNPLTFKQQKSLVTTGMDGVVGVMKFIKNLNDVIIFNSDEDDLKIYDRIPVILALRKDLSLKPLDQGETSVDVEVLMKNFKKYLGSENSVVEGEGFKVNLFIPTLKQENRIISSCIEDLKKMNTDAYGKNVSIILSYEIPKFIKSFEFGENLIEMESLSTSDRIKIMDNLQANVTNKIVEFISKIREYDEELLTHEGVTYDVDSSFFE